VTKFYYMSDLHLEINGNMPISSIVPDPEGIALVAGDTFLAAYLRDEAREHYSANVEDFNSLLDLLGQFKKTFFVLGNHEHYKGNFDDTAKLFRRELKNHKAGGRFTLLDNALVNVNEYVAIVGGTLWTDMGRNNPISHNAVGGGMNDFRIIRSRGGLFSTYEAAGEHAVTKGFIQAAVKEMPQKTIIVMTHHAPSYESNGEEHTSSNIIDGYCSDMTDFILDNPNITHWVHGHTHVNKDYHVGQCRVLANQMGYAYGHYADGCSKEFLTTTQPRFFEI